MTKLQDLAERVDRLVLRHEELKRTSVLMEQQLQALAAERDSLKSRLSAARSRIDALLARLPTEGSSGNSSSTSTSSSEKGAEARP